MKSGAMGLRLRRSALTLFSLALFAASVTAEAVSFSADSVQSTLAKGKESTVLSGRAKVKTGSVSITADRIELFGKDFPYLNCTGKVIVVDTERQIRLETPSLYYDRVKKLARAQGPSVLQDDKNKLVLKAEWIENDGQSEVTLAQVAIRIIKDKLACRAEYALYRRKESALELTGSPTAYKDGDEYKASRIFVNTDTEDISLEGEVSGHVSDKSSGNKDASSSAPAVKDAAAGSQDAASTNQDALPPGKDAAGNGTSGRSGAP